MQLRKRVAKVQIDVPLVQKRKYNKHKFSKIIHEINFSMAKHLKNNSCAIRVFKIDICCAFEKYLFDKYGVKKRYLKCQRFLSDHFIEKSNQVDKNNRYYIDETSFSII